MRHVSCRSVLQVSALQWAHMRHVSCRSVLQVSALHSAQRALVADGSFDSDALGALVDLVQGALQTHL
jgi:hypothetical protein